MSSKCAQLGLELLCDDYVWKTKELYALCVIS
jgi:hypothetical protein